jgi:hypothetical protein
MDVVKRVHVPWRVDPKLIERMRQAAIKMRRSQVLQVEIALEEWLDKFEAENK